MNMAKGTASKRVIGRNGEHVLLEGDELSFKTGGGVEHMAVEVVTYAAIVNTEQARELVNTSDLVPHGAWTKEMGSTAGKSVFLVIKGRAHMWVMEITKNQVPNASSFVEGIAPKDEEGKNPLAIPNRVINTPLGGLFAIGSIVCLILATFLVFSWDQPLLGLLAAAASIFMYIHVK